MSKPFDYSKWDKIELSDDEEDVHPNIDRESWFRMKHRSRVEREDHEDKDKQRINNEVWQKILFDVWAHLICMLLYFKRVCLLSTNQMIFMLMHHNHE